MQQLNKKYFKKNKGGGEGFRVRTGEKAKTRNRKKALLRSELAIAGMKVWSANH